MEIFIPLQIVSEANKKQHWSKAHSRHKRQKEVIRWELIAHRVPRNLPVHITMCRLSPRLFDEDNLVSAFKWVRDAIAEHFIQGLATGRADDNKALSWSYSQEKSSQRGISLEFKWLAKAEVNLITPLSLPVAGQNIQSTLRVEDSSSQSVHKSC